MENSAIKFESRIIKIESLGKGAATIIEKTDSLTSAQREAYAKHIADTVPEIYMAAVLDSYGKGFNSYGDEIDLAKKAYYEPSTSSTFSYTKNDEIMGKSAYVWTVPLLRDDAISGHICLFMEDSTLAEILPKEGYGGNISIALIDDEGNIIADILGKSVFSSGNNFFVNFKGARLEDLNLTQIKLRVERQNKMIFYAEKDLEHKLISVVPVGVNNWQLVTIMNKHYVENMAGNQTKESKKLLIGLSITISLFVAILIFITILGRFRHSRESMDLNDKAETDLLTGLSNKIATERKIQEYMEENPSIQCIMFLLDIDNFKKINDTMGHAFGDEVLKSLGEQLRNEFRVTGIIGRLGGDEFVIFLKNIRTHEQLEREGMRLVQFFSHFKAGGYVKYSATASIGGVIFPKDAGSFEEAYKAADKALYEAKRRGKNQLVMYGKCLNESESIKSSEKK